MDKNIHDGLEAYLKKLCAPGTPMEIRLFGQAPRTVKATGDVRWKEGLPYVPHWGMGFKDPATNMEGWVMIDFVYLK